MDHLHLQIKAAGEETPGRFTGKASIYSVEDLAGDTITPGAFTKTLARGNTRPLLWSHSASDPIGVATFTDSAEALLIEGWDPLESTCRHASLSIL